MSSDNIDITVGNGTTSKAAIALAWASGLGAAGLGITTTVGALPDSVPAYVGVVLTAVAGTMTAVSLGILAFSRNFWAGKKAEVMAAAIVTNASQGDVPSTSESEPPENDPDADDLGTHDHGAPVED